MLTAIFILSVMVIAILLMIANVWSTMRTNSIREKDKTERLALLCTHALEAIKDIFEQDLKLNETINGQSDNIARINEIEREIERIIDEEA